MAESSCTASFRIFSMSCDAPPCDTPPLDTPPCDAPPPDPPAKKARTAVEVVSVSDCETVSVTDSTAAASSLLRVSALRLQLKEFAGGQDGSMKIKKDFAPAFADKMAAALQESLKRARANGRRTLMACDV